MLRRAAQVAAPFVGSKGVTNLTHHALAAAYAARIVPHSAEFIANQKAKLECAHPDQPVKQKEVCQGDKYVALDMGPGGPGGTRPAIPADSPELEALKAKLLLEATKLTVAGKFQSYQLDSNLTVNTVGGVHHVHARYLKPQAEPEDVISQGPTSKT